MRRRCCASGNSRPVDGPVGVHLSIHDRSFAGLLAHGFECFPLFGGEGPKHPVFEPHLDRGFVVPDLGHFGADGLGLDLEGMGGQVQGSTYAECPVDQVVVHDVVRVVLVETPDVLFESSHALFTRVGEVSMPEASRINAKLSIMNENKVPGPTPKLVTSYDQLRRRVETLDWSRERKDNFLLYCKKYPQGSLDYVWKNLFSFEAIAAKQAASDRPKQVIAPAKEESGEAVTPRERVVLKPPVAPKLTRPSFQEMGDENGILPSADELPEELS